MVIEDVCVCYHEERYNGHSDTLEIESNSYICMVDWFIGAQ